MASKKFQELQGFTPEELRTELDATERSYQKMKFDHAVTGLDNPLTLREVRRDIARLKTEITRRQLADASAEEIANRSKKRARRRAQK